MHGGETKDLRNERSNLNKKSPGSLSRFLAERESLNIESMKNPTALLHPWNARRLHRYPLRPGRPLATPSLGLPSRQEGRFVSLRFARNGATGCQERVLACRILQSEMVRSTSTNW